MLDYTDLVGVIKKAAVDAVVAGKPTELVFGKVVGVGPLKIQIDQKLTLTAAQLILTRNVTDYYTDMSVEHVTEASLNVDLGHTHTHSGDTQSGGDDSHTHAYSGTTDESCVKNLTHTHAYKGRKRFLVHNSLVVGDQVLMIQMQGGQKYIVMDRVVKT